MDAEREVVDYLNAKGLGATAYYDVPSERPATFIVVERTGGEDGELVIERPMLDIQCWAGSRRDAALLADAVKGALRSMPYEVDDCFYADLTSTFRDYDLDSGTPRYHVVTEITFNR